MQKVTIELDEATMAALSRLAAAHDRTPASEAEDIVRRDCAGSVDRDAFLRRAREAVQRDARAPFDREAFLRRARELAMKSRTDRAEGTPSPGLAMAKGGRRLAGG